MQTVLLIDIHAIVAVFQDEDSTRRAVLRGRYDCVEAERHPIHIAILLYIIHEIEPKLIEAQVHNRDARLHVFYIDDFFLELL